MSPVNSARFEEGTEIVADQEVEVGDTGWTLNYADITRVGSLVAVHIEATNAAGAAAPVLKLQADFAPGDTIQDPSGGFTLAPDGTLTFTGSTAASAKHVAQLVYKAGAVSP